MRYPADQEALARQLGQFIDRANKRLAQLLALETPAMEILLVAPQHWKSAPHEETGELDLIPTGNELRSTSGQPVGEVELDLIPTGNELRSTSGQPVGEVEPDLLLPYWTDVTSPPSLVIPTQLDPIMGSGSPQKLAFLVFHELAHAFLEADTRPWPLESPLWADEWQMQFAALWLFQQEFDVQGVAMTDLHETFGEIFRPEPDGKTPVTVRGFDWYEDTTAHEYLEYTLLLERFAADLLANYDATILPRFLESYRAELVLLSDDVTAKLAEVLGESGIGWLENLDYF